MESSKRTKILLVAIEKGYRIDDGGIIWYQDKRVNGTIDTRGYKVINIRLPDGNCGIVDVHRMQAFYSYGGAIFKGGIQVRHRNGKQLDNSRSNILIGTQSDNMMDRTQEERRRLAIDASWVNRRFTDKEVRNIKKDRRDGYSYRDLIFKYGASKSFYSYMFNKSIYASVAQ